MKRIVVVYFVLCLMVLSSCGTFNVRYHYFQDAKKLEGEKVALVAVDRDITIKEINGKSVFFNLTAGDKVIYLEEGEYRFTIKYWHYYPGLGRAVYTDKVVMESFKLEGGKHYFLAASI